MLPARERVQEELLEILGAGRAWRQFGHTMLGQRTGNQFIYVVRSETCCAQSIGYPSLAHQIDNRAGENFASVLWACVGPVHAH